LCLLTTALGDGVDFMRSLGRAPTRLSAYSAIRAWCRVHLPDLHLGITEAEDDRLGCSI